MIAGATRLGPYEIIASIGAGGMGEVYHARDTRLGRDVAIKVLPSSFSADQERLHRFQQEACAAGALNHPNILSIYDTGAHDSSPYVVSEMADGLAAPYEKGIVHRDLKPENLFLTNDRRVKILDFGLAKLTGTADGSL